MWPLPEMSRFSMDNNNFPYDNNVLVLDMVLGSLWGISQPINWDNVAKLVPGFTPDEVPTSTWAWSALKCDGDGGTDGSWCALAVCSAL